MFWKSSGMEIAQPLWAIMPVLNHWMFFSLYSVRISLAADCNYCRLFFCYEHLRRVQFCLLCNPPLGSWTTVSRCSSCWEISDLSDLSLLLFHHVLQSPASSVALTDLTEDVHVIFVPRCQAEPSAPAHDSQEGMTICWLCCGWCSLGNSSLAGTGAHWALLSHLLPTRIPTYVPCCKDPSQHSIGPQPAVVHGFAPSQVQDLAFLFVELSEAPVGPFPQLVKCPWIAVKPPAHSVLPWAGIIHRGACQAITQGSAEGVWHHPPQ